jgi:galacturan 1,4-alpha-galacturonidase
LVRLLLSSFPSHSPPNTFGLNLILTLIRGVVQNIRFENFSIAGAAIGPDITQDSGDNGSYPGTSKMEISNIAFVNFKGYMAGAKGTRTAAISCSEVHPCYNIALKGMELASSISGSETGAVGTCAYVAPGGVSGLNGC